MQEIQLVPGAINTPNPITLPAGCPDIDAVVSAQIWRLPVALGLNNHTQAQVVAALASHAVHSHPVDVTANIPFGVGTGVQATAAAGPAGYPGGGVTVPGGVGGVTANLVAQAHTAGGATVPHDGAADPVVAAVPTKLTQRTFRLNVNALLGDILTLIYLEQGARLQPA